MRLHFMRPFRHTNQCRQEVQGIEGSTHSKTNMSPFTATLPVSRGQPWAGPSFTFASGEHPALRNRTSDAVQSLVRPRQRPRSGRKRNEQRDGQRSSQHCDIDNIGGLRQFSRSIRHFVALAYRHTLVGGRCIRNHSGDDARHRGGGGASETARTPLAPGPGGEGQPGTFPGRTGTRSILLRVA